MSNGRCKACFELGSFVDVDAPLADHVCPRHRENPFFSGPVPGAAPGCPSLDALIEKSQGAKKAFPNHFDQKREVKRAIRQNIKLSRRGRAK